MAGGKLTPRQKMINLMYLVFIAMLALNMSKEVLSAFGLMDEKFEEVNSAAKKTNEEMLSVLAAKAAENVNFKNALDEANQVKTISNEFYNYLESVKSEISKVPQTDLFAEVPKTNFNPFNTSDDLVKHQLIEETKEEETTSEVEDFGFSMKFSTSEFETPVVPFEVTNEADVEETKAITPASEDDQKTDESMEEQLRKSKERILRLKDLSMKLRSTSGLVELENEPAYKRKQMQLKEVPHSSESQVSRFTLSNEDGQTEIRPNNSFLHDNVD